MTSDFHERVFTIIGDCLVLEREAISLDSRFQDDLKADSLDMFTLVIRFEDEFSISIPDDVAARVVFVRDAIALLEGTSLSLN